MSKEISSPVGPAQRLIDNLEARDAALAKLEKDREKPPTPLITPHEISNEHKIDLIWGHIMTMTDYNSLENAYRKAKNAALKLENKVKAAHAAERARIEKQHIINLKKDWESFAPYICIKPPLWVKSLKLDRPNAAILWNCNVCGRKIDYDLLKIENRTQDGRQAIHAVIDGAGLWITFRCNHAGSDYRDRPSGFVIPVWIDREAIINHATKPNNPIVLSDVIPDALKVDKPQILVHPFSSPIHGKKTSKNNPR